MDLPNLSFVVKGRLPIELSPFTGAVVHRADGTAVGPVTGVLCCPRGEWFSEPVGWCDIEPDGSYVMQNGIVIAWTSPSSR